jgi:plastocyanin
MRTNLRYLILGTVGMSVVALLTVSGHAGDYYGYGSDTRGMRTYPRRSRAPEYPPIEPYRQLYFFPHAAPSRPAPDKLREVTLYDNYYSPSILYVTSGTTVRWTNQGTHHHTVTCNWRWESGELMPGDSFSLQFSRVGTYDYYCRLHSKLMRGKVVVYY